MEQRLRGFEFTQARKQPEGAIIKLPQRASKHSAGYDFFCPVDVEIPAGGKVLVWTDVKAYMQEDEVLLLDVRSSFGIKKDLMLANTIGIIDSDYYNNPGNEGNIGVCLRNLGIGSVTIVKGETFAQGIFTKFLESDNGNTEEERVGGIGSTTK